MFGKTLYSGTFVILSCLVYDAQFLSVSIHKVGKHMMPSVLKSVEILNVVYVFQH